MTSTTVDTLKEFGATLDAMNAMGEALDIGPCEALEAFFPAIVGDDDTMGALSTLLTPVIGTVVPFVEAGTVTADEAEEFVHNVFHLLQISAALGHMLGVSEALGMSDDIPGDLSLIAWDNLPDVFGEDDGPEAA